MIAPQLNACGEVVELAGVQVELVVPAIAVTAADAPVPPPNVALSAIPPTPLVAKVGPVKAVMLGLLTVTVAVALAARPAWLVTVSVKVVVACSAVVVAESVLVATLEVEMLAAGSMVNVHPVHTVPVKVVVPPGLIGLVPLTLKAMELDGLGVTFTCSVALVVEFVPLPSVTVSW